MKSTVRSVLILVSLFLLVAVPCVVTSGTAEGIGTVWVRHTPADESGPTLTVSIDPEQPTDEEIPVVSITAVDADGVDTVILSYSIDAGSTWVNKTAELLGDAYVSTLPTTDEGTLVMYKAYANDTLGNWSESETFSYVTAAADSTGPEIVIWYAPDDVSPGDEVTAYLAVGDPSGVSYVVLSVSRNGGAWENVSLEYDEANMVYYRSLGPVLDGEILSFKAYANDTRGNWSVSETITISFAHSGTTGETTTETTTTSSTEESGGHLPGVGDILGQSPGVMMAAGAVGIVVILLIVKRLFLR